MDKTAQGKGIGFASKLPKVADSLNPKKIDPYIYRQLAVFLGVALLLAAGFYIYLRVGQEMTVRQQQKAKETQTAVQDKKLEERQLAAKQDQQRKMDLATINSALKSYFLENKKAPETLKELVPKSLTALPLDPKSKKEYNYSPTADRKGWRVWAVLSDGTPLAVKGP